MAHRKPLPNIAHVETCQLSDESFVYNVVIPAAPEYDCKAVRIGAMSETDAYAIRDALNMGVAWIE